ncbi:ubx domain protein [Gigaspora margarita]|uniref:Ubx domain protein n=1 Tax=Gigaspora margarita TaxID=4874 RepID=A0A8H4A6Z9_GIGMA|nr:ubx domain protein [Gigaspora margarita]
MAEINDEELITKFCNVTNATQKIAIDYLAVSDGNVEQAITLYLESGGADLSALGTGNNRQETSTVIDAVDLTGNDTFDSDAELAKQLAQEDYSEIRAPIAPKRDILVRGDHDDFNNLFEDRLIPGIPRNRRTRDVYRTFAGDISPGDPSTSSREDKADRLTNLFKPPFEIMHKDSFERTRTKAREEGKWLMVDIQEITEFSCQVLNRDLWSNQTVQDVIRQHFLFLQFNADTADGRQYINFYPIESYPHIAIIDPLTGERLKVWNASMEPTEFIMNVTDFLERYSSADYSKNPLPQKSKSAKSYTDMSEEEQLRAALKESRLYNNEADQESEDETMEVESEPLEKETNIADQESEDETMEVESEPLEKETNIAAENSVSSTFDSIRPVERVEVVGPNATAIKFRLPDGKNIMRRFDRSDPVRYLFEFVKVSVPEAQEKPFELVYHRNNLINQVEQTVNEAELSNAVVNVVFG